LISGLRRARARAGGGRGRPASSRRGGSGVAVSAWRVWAVRGQGSPFFCFFLFLSARRRARGSQSPDHDCGGRRGGVKHQIQTACAMRLDVARRRVACTCEASQTCDGLVTAGAGTSYRCSRPSPSWRIKMHEERKSRDTHQTQKTRRIDTRGGGHRACGWRLILSRPLPKTSAPATPGRLFEACWSVSVAWTTKGGQSPCGTRVRRTKLNESKCGLESSAATASLRVGWHLLKAPPLPTSAPSSPPVVRWGDQRPSLFLCPPTGARADVVAGTPAPSTVAPIPREGLGRGQTGWVFSGEDQSPPSVALSARAAVNRFASADQGHGVAATPPGQDGRSPSLTWTGDGGGIGIVGR